MDMLLKILFHKCEILDCESKSASNLLALMYKESCHEYRKETGKKEISSRVEKFIRQTNAHTVFSKVMTKHIIMRVRMKISYSAFCNKQTIPELIFSSIYLTKCEHFKFGHLGKGTQLIKDEEAFSLCL